MLRSALPLLFLLLASPALAQDAPKPAIHVVLDKVAKPMVNHLEALGTTKANESVDIRPKVTGIVSEVLFDDGQEVDAGAMLIIIDRDIESAQQKEAGVNLAEQRREYDRISKMAKDGAIAATKVDEQKAKLKLAEASLEAQTARLGDRMVKAPFSGVLGLRRVSPGTLVDSQTSIATLDDVSTLKLDFTIPEIYLTSVKEGMEIQARSDAYENEQFKGTVKAVESRIDPITRSATVRAVLPNESGKLRPGMLLYVDLITSQKERLVVAEKAIVPEKDKHFVYVADGKGGVEKRPVKLGFRYPGLVEIVEGLQVGEDVVSEGVLKIRPGVTITTASAETAKDAE